MKYMKGPAPGKLFVNLLLILFMIPPVSLRSQATDCSYISTSEAQKRFSSQLENLPYLVFPEIREQSIQWYDSLKTSWLAQDDSLSSFKLAAEPGEYFVYQLGVWAFKGPIRDIKVLFSDLERADGKSIPAGKMTCFNEGGTDGLGNPFSKTVNISHGRLQALWVGIDLTDVKEGTYEGSVYTVSEGNMQSVPIQLDIRGDEVDNHGFNEGKRLSRMAWLNTSMGMDDSITRGYEEIGREGNLIKILGRSVTIAPSGLPAEITSFFEPSNQFLVPEGKSVTSHPFQFIVEKENSEVLHFIPGKLEFTDQSPGHLSWQVINSCDECELICYGRMEFDGYVNYKLMLRSKETIRVKDIRLEIPVNKNHARYMMGLNHEGGNRASSWEWKWDTARNQDMLWLGNVNGGLRIKWKAENYVRPLINIYYAFGPLHLPPSWGNGGKGGVDVKEKDGLVLVRAYSGDRELKPGEVLNYDFELLITPFKKINKEIKYGDRYFHGGGTTVSSRKVDMAKKAGANILNIHHAEDIYPFINYPYLDENTEDLLALVKHAHEHDIRLKLYYTTRELTNHLPEFWAFNSLDGELIFPGPGNETQTIINKNGPAEWLKTNLRENYIPAWFNPIEEGKFKGAFDLSVITNPDSRLNNFYIGGLNWMVRNLDIDGVYIDDSALDRITLRRARKIIDGHRPGGRMDLHSWNHFNQWAGYANCLNLYMDLLPYFDLVWIGEGRDYDRMPDHWLVEVSGIPFGLPGQMLEGGGNPWRGMIYGITNRAGWGGDPMEIWKFWDQYHIMDKQMIGYWDPENPVKSSNELVKATLYKGPEVYIIAVANWEKKDLRSSICIDWEQLGVDKSLYKYHIPAIPGFQEEQSPASLESLLIPGGKGYLIVIQKK
jgi:hypothetical protein